MVAQAHRDHLRVISLVLLQAKHLRGAAFRRNAVRGGVEIFITGAVGRVGHAEHGATHQPPVRRARVANLRLRQRRLIRLHAFAALGLRQQMRRNHFSVIDQRHHRLHHLNRRGDPVALPDAHRNRIALIPAFFMHLELPFAARQQAAVLFVKIDAGGFSVAELTEHAVDTVDAHHKRHLIEEGVGGLLNRFGDVQHAVTAFFPVAIAAVGARQRPGRRAKEVSLRGDYAGQQRRHRHIGLHRRRGRIEPLGNAVDQRQIFVLQQRLIGLIADAFYEGIGIVAGAGDHRQHRAVVGILHQHRRALPGQQALHILLQMQIESQRNIFARHRRHLFQHAHNAAVVIHLYFPIARLAVQQRLVIALDTLLADIVVGGVVLGDARGAETLIVAIVDFRDVADNVRQVGAVGIFAILIGIDADAGEAVLVHREARHLFLGQLLFQHERLVAAALF